ncbi:MAG TPA: LPXTG cell wall anchor domain-containing protein, partial [Clostridia bacterium]|nr:LPXTG cell wall anchor domain-containing protein [Clostridia bacterium]
RYSGGGTGGDGGKITITGGNIAASGYTGTAIGGGYGTLGGSGGEVTITGGTVTATGNARGNTNAYIIGVEGIGGGRYDVTSGTDGTFQTTNNGNAVIFASSIGDQSHKADWSGIIFEGDEGEVYGNPTLADDLTIPENKALDIPSGKTLTVNSTITVQGTLTNNGKIYVDGTFTGTADNLYYPLTITNATGSGDISEYNSKTYGKAGGKITLTPDTPPTGYSFDKWVVLPSSVTVNANNSFTMPSTPLELTAQWKDIENPVITGIENDRTYCAEVEFEASDNDGRPAENNPNTGATVPQTGDNSNLFLWVALLFVSGFGVVVTTVYSKKRASAK